MTPVLVSVDKAGDLKLGRKKCRLHKKDDVVKVAKNYGVPNAGKKTVKQLCGSIKARAKASNDGMNNVPLAKLYPEAAKKRAATKKKALTPSMKAALKKKAVTNFMKGMVTTNSNIKKLRELNEKPSKKAKPLTKEEAIKRISAMKGINKYAKGKLMNHVERGTMSPRRVVKVAREASRLNAPEYRIAM